MSKKHIGTTLVVIGSICLISSLALVFYNNWEDQKAGQSSNEVLTYIQGQLPSNSSVGHVVENKDDLQKEIPMPMVVVDGNKYVGTIEIEAINISLPVLSSWSDNLVKIAPCRYTGSVYNNSMIIAAHNYTSHFGKFYLIESGDIVKFTDINNEIFTYRVLATEILDATDIEDMHSGDWDLTLFTCTKGGKERVTLRCELIK